MVSEQKIDADVHIASSLKCLHALQVVVQTIVQVTDPVWQGDASVLPDTRISIAH